MFTSSAGHGPAVWRMLSSGRTGEKAMPFCPYDARLRVNPTTVVSP